MLATYEAVLRGDRLEGKDAVPREARDEGRTVYILFPAETSVLDAEAISDRRWNPVGIGRQRAFCGTLPPP